MKGDLPDEAGEMTTIEVCSTGDDGCISPLNVTVKKCQNAYVSYLQHLSRCPEAYCVGWYIRYFNYYNTKQTQ